MKTAIIFTSKRGTIRSPDVVTHQLFQFLLRRALCLVGPNASGHGRAYPVNGAEYILKRPTNTIHAVSHCFEFRQLFRGNIGGARDVIHRVRRIAAYIKGVTNYMCHFGTIFDVYL
jgi:hypothetical protein